MRFLIASTIVPFIEGGGTFIVDWLDQILKKYGHQSEVLKLPFHSYYPEMLEQMLALRLMDVSEHADRLITIRTPSYLLKHPNKVLWFIHHHRGAYDLWGTQYQDIPNNPEGLKIRDAIVQADNLAFAESRKIFTNSQTVSDRLMRYNQVKSEVLYPPLMNSERYICRDYSDYIFYPSRITGHKRQALAVEAMRYTKTPVRLLIAGAPENQEYLDSILNLVAKFKLHEKVQLVMRWISDEEKFAFFADALAATYLPFDEDSYGYPSLEAYHSRKAVVTCSDSGGTLELIQDQVNGRVVAPHPEALAEAFDRLYADKSRTRRQGEAGFQRLRELNISWDHVVQRFCS